MSYKGPLHSLTRQFRFTALLVISGLISPLGFFFLLHLLSRSHRNLINFPSSLSGWVVTWFLLGYTVRMFEYTVRTFRSNVGRFLYVFSSIPRKIYTIFQPTFSPIQRYQDSIFKLLTLSTNSVTNVVRTAYFQIQARSSPLKNL